MSRISLEKDSLGAKLRDIESLISPKQARKLTLEDLESLSSIADKIGELLSTTVSKLVPNVVKNNKYNASSSSSYRDNGNSIYSSTPSNSAVGIASISEQPQLSVSGDLGTGFSGSGGISLFDVTDEVNNNLVNKKVIETLQAQNPGAVIEELPIDAELSKLNDIFGSVEDVQQE